METLVTKRFLAKVNIMTHKNILDRQGRVVTETMPKLGLPEIKDIRIGKHIEIEFSANSSQELIEKACKEVLVNEIMEFYNYKISEI
jgi:phosphoribosylformylglycinamidine synthase